MIDQLKRENDWLKSINESNQKDKERSENLEKTLNTQFEELKAQVDALRAQIDDEKNQSTVISKQYQQSQDKNSKLEAENQELKLHGEKLKTFMLAKDDRIEEQDHKLALAIKQIEELKQELKRGH